MNAQNQIGLFAFIIFCVLILFMGMGADNSKKHKEDCESKGGQYYEPSRGKAVCHKGEIK